MNAATRMVSIVNHSSAKLGGSLEIGVYNLDGSLVVWTVQSVASVAAASAAKVIDISAKISAASSDICFVSLKFSDKRGKLLAENFYWYQKSGSDTNYTTLARMKTASAAISTKNVTGSDGTAKKRDR